MTIDANTSIDVLLTENRQHPPSPEFSRTANVTDPSIYEIADADPEGFWAKCAEELHWFRKWDTVLEWDVPWAKWFSGGKINASYNCLDRHLETRGQKTAIMWEGEFGEEQTLYLRGTASRGMQVCQRPEGAGPANRRSRGDLHGHGAGASDRHAGLRPHRLPAQRGLWRVLARFAVRPHQRCRGKGRDHAGWRLPSRLGRAAQAERRRSAREHADVEHVVVLQRAGEKAEVTMQEGRDHWWHDLMEGGLGGVRGGSRSTRSTCSTSSTPPAPPASPRASCTPPPATCWARRLTTKWVFDLKDDDIYWCTADIGWVTGHSYIVYGPLANGATTVMYEGAPDYPDKDRFWALIEKYKVTILYTAPTSIRMFMKWGTNYPGETRSLLAASAGNGGRADQSRSLDVVQRAHRPRQDARSWIPGGRRRPA